MRVIDAALLAELVQGAISPVIAAIAPVIASESEAAGINTPLRAAHFLAQIAWESARFTRLVEDLDYSAGRIAEVWPRLASRAAELAHNPVLLANAAYATVGWNRGEASGDGWRYRGRGLFMLTGRWNYNFFGRRIGEDLIAAPDRAADAIIAARLALAYWTSRDCNEDADRGDIEAVTRRVAGSLEGLDGRHALKLRAYALLTA